MRIAISGSHATGKSTLVRELVPHLSGFTAVDEPYYLLADERHAFGDPPTVDDFASLFDRSVSLLTKHQPGSVLFDRSPADYLAYLAALRPGTGMRDQVTEAAHALATLDLVVFVPIERPDRVDVTDAPGLRRRVDGILRDMLVDRAWGFDVPVVEVHGSPEQRAEQVLTHVVIDGGLPRQSHSASGAR